MFSIRPWNKLQEECLLPKPFVSWNELPKSLKPGDLIEFSRPSSSKDHCIKHWSVFEGEKNGVPYAIHYTKREEVVSEPLEDVARGRKGRMNNDWDERWDPLPQEEVLKRAHEQMQLQTTELTSNEHFALECRYGKNWMKPVMVDPPLQLIKTIYEGTMVIMMIPVAVVIFSSLYWMGRGMEAIKKRREATDAKDDK